MAKSFLDTVGLEFDIAFEDGDDVVVDEVEFADAPRPMHLSDLRELIQSAIDQVEAEAEQLRSQLELLESTVRPARYH